MDRGYCHYIYLLTYLELMNVHIIGGPNANDNNLFDIIRGQVYGSITCFICVGVGQQSMLVISFANEVKLTSYFQFSIKILKFESRVSFFNFIKGELQRENKLISYERAFKMLENDMYIAGIGQVVLELLSFKVESGNHQRGIFLLQKFSDIFGNMRLVPLKMTSHLTSHNFQILKIEIFCKLYKI